MCAGAFVCWFSRTQKCVTLSTTEAEYVALTDTIKEAMFMRYVWSYIFPGFGETCITVFEDNEGARHLAQKPTVYVELKTHRRATPFFAGAYFQGKVWYYPCRVGGAAFLTKPLNNAAFQYHRGFLTNIDASSR